MSKAREMGKRAALCRKAAAHPTHGDGGTDKLLTQIAEQLEHDAEYLARKEGASGVGSQSSTP